MATLSSIITPTNITTASNTQTLTNKTITGGIYNGTVGATTPSTGSFSTLSATGITTVAAGSAALPAIVSTTGTADTGLWFPAADTIAASTAGTERVRITSAGAISLSQAGNSQTTDGYRFTRSGGAATTALFMGGDDNAYLYNTSTGGIKLFTGNTDNRGISIDGSGNVTISGSLSKGSGSFRIEHPLPSKSATHQLVHSFIEGPKCDLIYRGKVDLVDGKAFVNIDADSTMTEGTFEALCATVQCFTSNESGWGAIRGKVIGNILTIEAQDAASTDNVSWMVIGERKDKHIMDTDWTNENGRPIVEPLKPAEPALESK